MKKIMKKNDFIALNLKKNTINYNLMCTFSSLELFCPKMCHFRYNLQKRLFCHCVQN